MARHNRIGQIGEEIAVKYLKSRGYTIIDRNFRVYYGEIDIICRKGENLHIIEVKTVSRDTIVGNSGRNREFRPEDNIHQKKLNRLYKAIEIYLSERKLMNIKWQLDLITVEYSETEKKARVNMMQIL